MRRSIVIWLIALLFSEELKAQNSDWYLVINKKDQCGYKDNRGKMMVPFGTYSHCFSDTFRTIAFVAHKDSGIIAVNRNNALLFKVFSFDNGPDYPDEKYNLYRIVKNKKVGFADLNGKVAIEPRFDHAERFSDDVSAVCFGCSYTDSSQAWGYADVNGKLVIPAIYLYAESFHDGKAYVKNGNESYYIDKKGNRIRDEH